jgi:hypothetical protein
MGVKGGIEVNASKQKEQQESEHQQEPFETATESGHAGSQHMVASPRNGLVRHCARFGRLTSHCVSI